MNLKQVLAAGSLMFLATASQADEIRMATKYFSSCETKKAAEFGDGQTVDFAPMTNLKGLFASKSAIQECPSYIVHIGDEGGTVMPLLRFEYGKQNGSDTCIYTEDEGGMSRIGIRYTAAAYKCVLR